MPILYVFIQPWFFAIHSKRTHTPCGSFLTSFRVNGKLLHYVFVLCMHMIFTNTATSAEIFTCIITFLSPVLISFKIEYICILQEWWTTRFKHVVKWLRWLVGLSGQAVWQTVRGLCTGTCWWIALHIFTLTFKSEKCQC